MGRDTRCIRSEMIHPFSDFCSPRQDQAQRATAPDLTQLTPSPLGVNSFPPNLFLFPPRWVRGRLLLAPASDTSLMIILSCLEKRRIDHLETTRW
jgi:hypothetical protein